LLAAHLAHLAAYLATNLAAHLAHRPWLGAQMTGREELNPLVENG
jgi:hypothetical protein